MKVEPWDLPRTNNFGLDTTRVLSQLIASQPYVLTEIGGIEVIEKLIELAGECCILSPSQRPPFQSILNSLHTIISSIPSSPSHEDRISSLMDMLTEDLTGQDVGDGDGDGGGKGGEDGDDRGNGPNNGSMGCARLSLSELKERSSKSNSSSSSSRNTSPRHSNQLSNPTNSSSSISSSPPKKKGWSYSG